MMYWESLNGVLLSPPKFPFFTPWLPKSDPLVVSAVVREQLEVTFGA